MCFIDPSTSAHASRATPKHYADKSLKVFALCLFIIGIVALTLSQLGYESALNHLEIESLSQLGLASGLLSVAIFVCRYCLNTFFVSSDSNHVTNAPQRHRVGESISHSIHPQAIVLTSEDARLRTPAYQLMQLVKSNSLTDEQVRAFFEAHRDVPVNVVDAQYETVLQRAIHRDMPDGLLLIELFERNAPYHSWGRNMSAQDFRRFFSKHIVPGIATRVLLYYQPELLDELAKIKGKTAQNIWNDHMGILQIEKFIDQQQGSDSLPVELQSIVCGYLGISFEIDKQITERKKNHRLQQQKIEETMREVHADLAPCASLVGNYTYRKIS